MDGRCLKKLYIISFLDSFCTAMTLPVLNNYIVVGLNGSHFLLGLLSMLQIACQSLISPLLHPVTKFAGARNWLLISHVMTFLNYVIIGTADDYRLFLLFRVPFLFFNQTSFLSELLIIRAQKQHKNLSMNKLLKQLTSVAYIVGPFFGGLMYHDNSILPVACLLNILTILSLVLVCYLPADQNRSPKILYSESLIPKFWVSDWYKYWRNMSTLSNLKILTTIGLSCFLIKFTLVMGANFNASPSLNGFTISVHNVIFFSTQFSCQLIDGAMMRIHVHFRNLLLSCILLMTLSMYILCTTRSYGIYLLAFLVMAMSREMFERLWSIETEPNAQKEVEGVLKSITCFLPVGLGAYCDLNSHIAVQNMSLMPLIIAVSCGMIKFQHTQLKSKMKKVEHEIMRSFDVVYNKKLE